MSGDAIRFSVGPVAAVDMQTRAEAPLPTEEDFKTKTIALYGLCTQGTSEETLFNGSTVLTYDAASTQWTYTPLRYWTRGGVYDFRAISPANRASTGGSAAQVQADFGDDYDLMVAASHVATPLASTASVDPVVLTFVHADAAVRFVFKKDANELRTCRITHFQVDNLSASGTMTYAWNGTEDTISWTPGAKENGVFAWTAATDDDALELADTYASFDGWHLAVPQTFGGATVRFVYKVGTDVMNAVLPIPDGTKWEPGMTYEYRIDIDKLAIGLTFAVNPWAATEVNGSYTIR